MAAQLLNKPSLRIGEEQLRRLPALGQRVFHGLQQPVHPPAGHGRNLHAVRQVRQGLPPAAQVNFVECRDHRQMPRAKLLNQLPAHRNLPVAGGA